ncbi:hypothetical protein TSUD_38080 [Trifolium subterraneum]|uniref:Uncharacterized protein n=1 Tax=Trifolium subterraneum TaxID=3900 RepID=A0A2Z6NUF4_TRISU|nr:hypothetical protein TSUD_38080 [Trifolium subterraneum]
MKQVSGDVSSASNPSPPVNESGKRDIQPSDLHQTEKTVDGDNNKSSEALVSSPQCLESSEIEEKSRALPPLARSKKRCTKSNSKAAWGKLISQSSESPRLQPFPLLCVSGLFLFSVSVVPLFSVFTDHKVDEELPIVCHKTEPVLILHISWPVAYVITQEAHEF